MARESVRAVIVDDHPMVVLGVRSLFHNRPEVEVVAYAADADGALAACREHAPDVAVLDVALEGSRINGVQLCRLLRAERADVQVVFYTGVGGIGLARRLFAAGAAGIVSKGDRSGDLLKAVLLAARGRGYTSPAFAARADQATFAMLSPKQLAALRLIAQGLDRRQIAERMGVGEETVKTHLAEVRRRLGAATSAQAVAIGLVNSIFDYADDEEDDTDRAALPMRGRAPDDRDG
jgi:DNA-binding NarL/FixJ family response regulator